jgi:hypothetical protein
VRRGLPQSRPTARIRPLRRGRGRGSSAGGAGGHPETPIIPAPIVIPAILPSPVSITEAAVVAATIVIAQPIATSVITAVILPLLSLQSRQEASQALLQVL